MSRAPTDLARLFETLPAHAPVAVSGGRTLTGADLRNQVADLAGALSARPENHWGVYYHDAWPALVALLALWQSGGTPWLPGDNQPATAEALRHAGCQGLLGDWPGAGVPGGDAPAVLTPTDADAELVIFTSGSNGRPKAIRKRWRQLLNELTTLENTFGAGLGDALFAGTVSHQHIYGLLFRLLWPLASGRPLLSEALRDDLGILRLAASRPLAWVASPAHLKRLHDDHAWRAAGSLVAVFSSGGPLPADAAARLRRLAGRDALEVYGSSETGGVAWRRQGDGDAWTPLPGMALEIDADGAATLVSPHLPDPTPCSLDDTLQPLADGRFRLGGRRDRIVKVEGKRVSLDAVARVLAEDPWVAEARVLQPTGRQRLGAVLILNEPGKQALHRDGRTVLARRWRARLAGRVEPVAIPRRWRYPLCLPETAQGKVPLHALQALFGGGQAAMPATEAAFTDDQGRVCVCFTISADLPWFAGHFPGQPVLPGVVQIDWAETCARRHFPLPPGGHRLEALKFHKLIVPGARLTLTLEWQAGRRRLLFVFQSSAGAHSSGRLVFGEPV